MNKIKKFETFLESFKGKGQDTLIENVKKGFKACFESENEEIPVSTDTRIKSAMYKAGQKYNGRYKDEYWTAIKGLEADLSAILPTMRVIEAKYDNERPPQSKEWIMIGIFQTPKGIKRICWVRIMAGGAGSVDDPLGTYDVTAHVETVSPKTIQDFETRTAMENFGWI